MITCLPIGGLGNQLFVYATCIATALKFNQPYCIPRKVHHPHYPKDHSYSFPNVKYCDAELSLPIYNEPHYHYSEIPFMPDVCLRGYFQSYKYFNDYKEDIIKIFGFDDIETKDRTCSIHYRAGDYIDFPNHHPVVTMSYLIRAMNFMFYEGYMKFMFFSDNIKWCKDFVSENEAHMIFRRSDISFSEGKTELEDLREMASCASNITANSSFSWWGAYVNPNPDKKIIMPSMWFGSELNHSTKDLYLPNSIIL